LLLYLEEGNPRRFVVPGVFVVKVADPSFRRTYKLWEEGRPPNVALEVTSRSTKHEDQSFKPDKFAEIGIAEYFLYDPTSDYLRPALQGDRRVEGRYEPIPEDDNGRLLCQELGLWLLLEGGDLALIDCQSGARLLTEAEAAQAEVERLRDKLREQGISEQGISE
jgi:Uma2 family endonuclease